MGSAGGDDHRAAARGRGRVDDTGAGGGSGDQGRGATNSGVRGSTSRGRGRGRSLGGRSSNRDGGDVGARDDNDTGRAGAVGSGAEDDTGDGQAGADGHSAAGAGDSLTSLVGARNNNGGGNLDGGDSSRRGSRGSSEDGGDGISASGNTGVAGHERSADTLEVADSLRDDLVGLTVGVQAGEDVLDEAGVRAVAGRISVVLAANAEHPGVQARGNDVRARESLDGTGRGAAAAGSRGSTRGTSRSRLDGRLDGRLGGLGGRFSGLSSGCRDSRGRDTNSLGNRTNGGREGDGDGDNRVRASRTVRNGRTTASDSLDRGSENSRSSQVAGNRERRDISGRADSFSSGADSFSSRADSFSSRADGFSSRDGSLSSRDSAVDNGVREGRRRSAGASSGYADGGRDTNGNASGSRRRAGRLEDTGRAGRGDDRRRLGCAAAYSNRAAGRGGATAHGNRAGREAASRV